MYSPGPVCPQDSNDSTQGIRPHKAGSAPARRFDKREAFVDPPTRRNRAWQVDFVPSATNPRNLPKQHAPTAQAND